MSVYVYDLTFPKTEENMEIKIVEALKSLGKKWCFQEEIGEKNGYNHFQIRVSLKKKSSQTKLISDLKSTCLKGAHVTKTSTNGSKEFYDYVSKTQTRAVNANVYTDKDPPPPVKTDQLIDFESYTLYDWQNELIEMCKVTKDYRSIQVIWDHKGRNGKSQLCEFLEFYKVAEEIPPYNSFDKISEYICSRRLKGHCPNTYIIDMPRGLKKDKMSQFISGIESIKNGVAFDPRYSAEKIRFNRPNIIIFTNDLDSIKQQISCLSTDRWQIKELDTDTKSLVDYTEQFFDMLE